MPRRGLVAVAVLVAAAALGVGMMAGQRSVSPPQTVASPPASPVTAPEAPTPTGLPANFVQFASEEFSIAYPREWRRLEARDPQVKLIVTVNGRDSFLVRVTPFAFAVGPEQLDEVRQFTDDVVTANTGVILVTDPKKIALAGLPGWFYLYTFEDGESKLRGVHSHYFLFRGRTLYMLVFQGLPVERFPELAPTFDRIAGTFRVTSS